MSTLWEMLGAAAESDAVLRLIDSKERATEYPYRTLQERALRMAGTLRRSGVESGQSVAIVLPTGIHFFDVFFGALALGAVPVPLYPPVRLGRLNEYHARTGAMLEACAATLLVTERRLHRILGLSLERHLPPLGTLSVEDCEHGAAGKPVRSSPDSLAFIQFSSGTTDQPKPIALSHRQILANVGAIRDAILNVYPETDERRHAGCSWLPLYHDMGLVGCVFVAMSHARDLTLLPPEQFLAQPALWLRAVSRYRATISPAPNFAYSLCAERVADEELKGVNLSHWLVALNGAEPVTPAVLERFVERFSRFGLPEHSLTPVYGLGEATLAVTFSPLDASWRWRRFDRQRLAESLEAHEVPSGGVELVSLGPPLPGFAIEIRDEGGRPRDERSVGSVWIKGPSLMSGYFRLAEMNDRVFDGEWLDTGDRGFLDQGELYLFGRQKDCIVLRGRNYAPQDIEAALNDLEGVRRGCVAAIGVLSSGGERLVVLAESIYGDARQQDALEGRIRAAVLERCSLTADVSVLEKGSLPRTSSGKISRARARDLYENAAFSAPEPVNALRLANELVRSYFAHKRARKPDE